MKTPQGRQASGRKIVDLVDRRSTWTNSIQISPCVNASARSAILGIALEALGSEEPGETYTSPRRAGMRWIPQPGKTPSDNSPLDAYPIACRIGPMRELPGFPRGGPVGVKKRKTTRKKIGSEVDFGIICG